MSACKRYLAVLAAALFLPVFLFAAYLGLHAIPAEAAPAIGAVCVDFEGLTAGSTYHVGDTFVDSGAVLTVHPFVWSTGVVFNGGQAVVDNSTLAGGSGVDVNTNNVNLQVDFGTRLEGLVFNYGEYGGNLNLEINGDFRNFDDFPDVDGLTIGGVAVGVFSAGGPTGRVHLQGPIDSFVVGGQELWLDDFCPDTACVEFESLFPGTNYTVGDGFVDSGVPISVEPFVWSNGTVFSGGQAMVDNRQLAGGWGVDVNTNNVTLNFHYDLLPDGLSLDFGEYGGNLNLEVNGDFRNFANFPDIDGNTIGGTQVKVVTTAPGDDQGRLYLFGPVYDFRIGGQELWIDNVCPSSACIEYESLPAAASYPVAATFSDAGVMMEVTPFTWSNGTVFTGGHALVSSSQMAGGTGQDMNLNNVNLAFDMGRGWQALSLLFGEYGGNVNVEANGTFTNVANLALLDGATLGGAQLSLLNGFGNDQGRLVIRGPITSFAIGGQELWIDHVCYVPRTHNFLPVVRN